MPRDELPPRVSVAPSKYLAEDQHPRRIAQDNCAIRTQRPIKSSSRYKKLEAAVTALDQGHASAIAVEPFIVSCR